MIRKQIFPHSDEIDDIRNYINQELINALTYYRYCLIEKLSTQDYLVLLDIHDGYKDHLNYVSHVIYDYDQENDKVIEREIEKILIGQDFSLTTEELENIILEMTQPRPIFDLGDVVVDSKENKKWIVTWIYTPWATDINYKSAYKNMRLSFPDETFFYAIRLKNGKKEYTAPESWLSRYIPTKR